MTAWVDLESPDPANTSWYATADAEEPLICQACTQPIGCTPFSVEDGVAEHVMCPSPPSESPGE